ncbi:hypothetical protein BH10PSE3_BH10PSE3_10730 [soil metagenome]
MLSTLMVLATMATVQAGPTSMWQDDPHEPWVIGPWRLSCGRDGNLSGWNYVEACGANASAGKVRLIVARSATEASTDVIIDGCPSRAGRVALQLSALSKPGPARVRLVRDALRRTIKVAVDRCGAGPALKDFVVRDSDIAAILEGSDGLKDLT